MKIKFNPNQDFQKEAIKNVVDLFDGIGGYHVKFSMGSEITPNLTEDEDLEDDFLLENLQFMGRGLTRRIFGTLISHHDAELHGMLSPCKHFRQLY